MRLAACAGLVLLGITAIAQEPPPTYKAFDSKRDAKADLKAGLAQAAKLKKNVLVYVGGNWSLWSYRLDELFATNPYIAKKLAAGFVLVRIQWSESKRNEKILSQFPKIPGYPHLFVLDSKGKVLFSQQTAYMMNYRGPIPARYANFLDTWHPRNNNRPKDRWGTLITKAPHKN